MKDRIQDDREYRWDSPSYVAFIHPFCIIRPDNEKDFSVDIKDLNENSYNHGLLCRVVAALPSPELKQVQLLVCADGAIAVPALPDLKVFEDVLDVLNGVMCRLLLGGHLCEAVDIRDVVHGSIHEKRAIWPTGMGQSLNAHLHSTMRMRIASTIDTIHLNKPKNVPVSDFFGSYEKGRVILEKLLNVSPTLFLRGFTELRYGNLVDALSNLWIVVEQLTELLWKRRFLGDPANHPSSDVPNRRRALGEDTRTWSTSIRQEMLFQKSIISSSTFAKLHPARKARNDLVHDGRRPAHHIVQDLSSAVLDLVHVVSGEDPVALRESASGQGYPFRRRDSYDMIDWNEVAGQQPSPLLPRSSSGIV